MADSMTYNGGKDIAKASLPYFHIGETPGHHWPCYPGEAIDAWGNQKSPAKRKPWPHLDGSPCAWPGGDPGNHADNSGSQFPTYFTYKKCNDNEYRVGYYVYFAKDGYAGPLSGHDHDWENVVVVWQRSPVSGYWAREMILLSGHGHWRKLKWADMITFNKEDGNWLEENPGRIADHPKIYIGSVKHQMFWNQLKSCWTAGCEIGNDEYRQASWYSMSDDDHLIESNLWTWVGQKIAGYDWGHATGHPSAKYDGLCDANGPYPPGHQPTSP